MFWNKKQPRWHGDKRPTTNPLQFVINGQSYDRLTYGSHPDDIDSPTCDDCGTPRGSIHEIGCDLEPCPRCEAQAISCDCLYEDD